MLALVLTRCTAMTPGTEPSTDTANGEPEGTRDDGATRTDVTTSGLSETENGVAHRAEHPDALHVDVGGRRPRSGVDEQQLGRHVRVPDADGRYESIGAFGVPGSNEGLLAGRGRAPDAVDDDAGGRLDVRRDRRLVRRDGVHAEH